jgi:hypothetical protein
MTAFTRLGSGIWDWERWTELGCDEKGLSARVLWLGLYTSAEARRHVPGLWHGGIPSMSDASRLSVDSVRAGLDLLLEHELVEYDPKPRVLRLCELPDCGEFPSNGKVIKGWWTKFKTVPQCAVRDAHVKTLHWIMETGAAQKGEPLSANHVTAWNETFMQITIPAPRKRGLRRLCDNNDTSNSSQPSLFGPSQIPVHAQTSGYPQHVDNSVSLRQSKEITGPETVSDTVSDTNRIPDPGSRIPESLSGIPDSVGGVGGARPVLTLVPPYGAADVLRELAGHGWDGKADSAYSEAVDALIPRWVGQGVTLGRFALLAKYNAEFKRAKSVRNAADLVSCDLPQEIAEAERSLTELEERLRMAAEARQSLSL